MRSATPKQYSYATKLFEGVQTSLSENEVTEELDTLLGKLLEPHMTILKTLQDDGDIDIKDMSNLIDALKTAQRLLPKTIRKEVRWTKIGDDFVLVAPTEMLIPGTLVEVHSSKGVSTKAVGSIIKTDPDGLSYAFVAAPNEDLEVGFYRTDDGEIREVSRTKRGQLVAYSILFIENPDKYLGEKHYNRNYLGKAGLYDLEPRHKMSLDDAADFGHETHFCMVCGKQLTNPESIERGIGPVCASRF